MKKNPLLTALVALLLLAASGCTTAPAAGPAETPQVIRTETPSASPVMHATDENTAANLPETLPERGEGEARILFINVGKADAALIQAGEKNVLIDTGTAEAAPRLLAALHIMGVERLDAVFLTHTHKDHMGGMEALGQNFSVGELYGAVYSENKKSGKNAVTELANDLNLPLTRLSAGDVYAMGDGASFTVLGPIEKNQEDDNDNSLVLMLSVNGRKALFTGDMQLPEEDSLLSVETDVRGDVLKVGNHGNPDATGTAFAHRVLPEIAVVSTNTSEDTDSANPRVIEALGSAKVFITQDFPVGVLVTVGADGTLSIGNPARPAAQAGVLTLGDMDLEKQTVTLENKGADADLSGWMLYTDRGDEMLVFPEGTLLPRGGTLTISGTGGGGEATFPGTEKPFHKKKADTAMLFDRFGNLVCSLSNGM